MINNPIILNILHARGIKTKKQIKDFISPAWDDFFYDPFKLKGMREAVKRIKTAIRKKEKIAIYGDFDGDGIPGAAIIYLTLKKMGTDFPMVYVSKVHDIDPEFVKDIAKKGCKLLIAVDLGVNSFPGCEEASALGVDVIMVEHHNIREVAPPCDAFIDPKQKGDKYPWPYLSGGGLALKLAYALSPKVFKYYRDYFLMLAGIALVHDLVPLRDENRLIVKEALASIFKIKPGPLLETMNLLKVKESLEYTGHEMIFSSLEKIINIFDSQLSCDLLISGNHSYTLIKNLTDSSTRFMTHLNESLAKIKNSPHIKNNILFEVFDDVPYILTGAIADRAFNIFRIPTVIIRKGEEFSRGSARSSKYLDLMGALRYCTDLLDTYGGHNQAVGFRIKSDNIKEFKSRFGDYLKINFSDGKVPDDKRPTDCIVTTGDLTPELYALISKLAPFGPGNPVPSLGLKKVKIFMNKGLLTVKDRSGAIPAELGENLMSIDPDSDYNINGYLISKTGNSCYLKINEISKSDV